MRRLPLLCLKPFGRGNDFNHSAGLDNDIESFALCKFYDIWLDSSSCNRSDKMTFIDVAILIEAKTTPKVDDVLDHIERLEKFRRCADMRGDKRQFIGAIAGATVKPNVIKFAQNKGLYVIVQTGRTVEIVPTPEGFQATKW